MKPIDVARETLRRAVELQVLETDDVTAVGSLLQDPRELVDALKADRLLDEKVAAALERLVELRPAPSRPAAASKPANVPDLSGGSSTLAPSRPLSDAGARAVLDPGSSTVMPSRPVEGTGSALLDPGSSTVGPSRPMLDPGSSTVGPSRPMLDPGSSTVGPSRPMLDPGSSTVAPSRPQEAPARSLLDPNLDTSAPARDVEPARRAVLDPTSSTVAPADELPDEPRGFGIDLSGGSSTLAPSRPHDQPKESRKRAPSTEGLVDLSVLEPEHRRAIEAAAFCRIALRLGKVTREQLRAAAALAGNVEEKLLEMGAIDQLAAMDIVAQRANTRVACGNCFGVLPADHDPSRPCPVCGQASASASARLTATIAGAGGDAQDIEGFPGQGGTFAGYELIERIAEGGMGVVFKARQTKLNRVVALKVMRGGQLANKERRRRFRQEAEAAAALRHPCIVPVHEIDEVQGYPFYTMEFVEGPTMDRYVQDGKLEPKRVTALVRGVADAVQHFHLRGIIHRDLKPGNILVAEDGKPKIIDFGIAKKLVPDSDSSTIEGEVLGTPYYMSPEQATGKVTEVDTRTDVYALGAILYELLTGAPPWKGYRQARLIAAIQEEDPEPIRAKNPLVELDLESIVMKAMAKERERRYQSAADLAADLERYENNMPVTARPATLGYRLKKYVRRRLPAVIGASVFVVMLTAVAIAMAIQASRTHEAVLDLLAKASDPKAALPDREAWVAEALGKESGNAAALALKGGLQSERDAEKAKLAAAEQQRALEQQKRDLEQQKALEAERRKAERAQQDARLKAEQEAAQAAERRAQMLLDQAAAKTNPLDAVPDLQEALVVVPHDSAALRAKIENKKIDVELALAREQVAKNQTGLARFWLDDARRLESSRSRAAEFKGVEEDLKKLESGDEELKVAHQLVVAGKWLAAKAKLEELEKLKVDPARYAADRVTVEKSCSQRAAQLVAEGRSLLNKGDAPSGLAKALEAVAFERSEAVKALVADCEREDALGARRKAAEYFKRLESQKSALVVLAQAAERVQDPGLKAQLEAERAARARLLDDRSLAGLCFVPDMPDLGVHALYMSRTEVTNAEWKQFVDAGGYAMPELWKGVSAEMLASFRDGCPGGTCNHKGPRTWTNGGYGDPANADRPVRGITIQEARAYALWKSRKGGKWRLPTDREWEVAAGFDPATQRLNAYPWGDDWRPDAISLATDLPRPVGATSADCSPLGLQDVAGNVMEWVEKDGQPGTKGVAFAVTEAVAKRFARVRSTGTPGESPPPELLQWIGLRLVRVIEEK